MAAVRSGRGTMDVIPQLQEAPVDLLKKLYPTVDETKTPLPRSWSPKEKFNYIGLSQNNLRVHYKGHGKTHRDAASVQASHPIPASCGLYYFEVKIVSKGRDGYMGIGLSCQGVNLNRLPGWDKQSYGYHGDDGHSFCSSGTGQPYGPTFTTGDVIGCGVNLVDKTCFYTKNGHHLGTVFSELPPNLYPTVGLQTPGEIVDANFGQEPFVFDLEDMIRELRSRTRASIFDFPVPESQGEWQAILHKMVSSYLIHHGYSSTAESLAQITDQPFAEDINSIKNRQKILKLVLAGRMGEAIDKTSRIYPGLLENNQDLLFMLKCRQFVEMVNGTDVEVCPRRGTGVYPSYASPNSPPIQTSVIQSTKSLSYKYKVDELNQNNAAMNGDSANNCGDAPVIKQSIEDGDVEMDVGCVGDVDDGIVAVGGEDVQNGHGTCTNGKNSNGYQNGNSHTNNTCLNQASLDNEDEDMGKEERAARVALNVFSAPDVDGPVPRKCCKPAVERILEFGRELYSMSQRLPNGNGNTDANQEMLENAFSLLAYSNPWDSPVGWQLDPNERESVYASLNSAILESNSKPRRPALEIAMSHAQELVNLMATSGLGSSAFASVTDLLEH